MRKALLVFFSILLTVFSASASAAGGTGEYRLPWGFKDEAIFYYSCGMADDCWVAEVRSLKNRQAIAQLHCDGERLLYTLDMKSDEQVLSTTCEETNTHDKPEKIRATFLKILKRSKQ